MTLYKHLIVCLYILGTICIANASYIGKVKSLGQYASLPKNSDGRMDLQKLLFQLKITYTNTYSFLLDDTTGDNYLDLVLLLDYLKTSTGKDLGLKLAVTLLPPSESIETGNTRCSIFVDSPLTTFNETSMLNLSVPGDPHGCLDYLGQANILNHLSIEYPNAIESINIDDFSLNLNIFTEEYCIKFQHILKRNKPHAAAADIINNNPIQFIPTYYYGKNGVLLLNQTKFKYLTTVLDGILFYFRNDKDGKSTCLPCNFSKSDVNCSRPCLYEQCSEKSISNFNIEVNDILSAMKKLTTGEGATYKLFIGIYFSPYHSCGPIGPSIEYDYEILKQAVSNENVDGVIVYMLKYPSADDLFHNCVDNNYNFLSTNLRSKGCAVQNVFKNYTYMYDVVRDARYLENLK